MVEIWKFKIEDGNWWIAITELWLQEFARGVLVDQWLKSWGRLASVRGGGSTFVPHTLAWMQVQASFSMSLLFDPPLLITFEARFQPLSSSKILRFCQIIRCLFDC
jgi:hypothetical protein